MHYVLWRFDIWDIIAYGDPMNGVGDFPQNICGYDHYIICLFCGNNMSLHCSMPSTRIKDTVPSLKVVCSEKMTWAYIVA